MGKTQQQGMGIGLLIRQWRQARGLTLGQVARRAGISVSTLSRWESEASQPNIPELEAAFAALGVRPEERQAVLESIPAPRAVRRLREMEDTAFAPVGGDLLRALRVRADRTQAQTAGAVGATQSQIAKWESGNAWPDAVRLRHLCAALGARPEEVAALLTGRFRLSEIDKMDQSDAPDVWEARLGHALLYAPADLLDLTFLLLEAKLWERRREYFALPLLALAYDYHARSHLYYLQPGRAGAWAERALGLARAWNPVRLRFRGAKTLPWGGSVIAAGACAAKGGGTGGLRRAARLIEEWLPFLTDFGVHTWALSELAAFHAGLGSTESALAISHRAVCHARQNEGDPYDLLFRLREHASLLAQVGRPACALETLEAARPLTLLSSDAYLRHYLLEAECQHALGRNGAASDALSRAETRYRVACLQEVVWHHAPLMTDLASRL